MWAGAALAGRWGPDQSGAQDHLRSRGTSGRSPRQRLDIICVLCCGPAACSSAPCPAVRSCGMVWVCGAALVRSALVGRSGSGSHPMDSWPYRLPSCQCIHSLVYWMAVLRGGASGNYTARESQVTDQRSQYAPLESNTQLFCEISDDKNIDMKG